MATLSSKALPTGLATLAQGTLADSAVQPNDSPTFNAVTATSYAGDGSALTGVGGSTTAGAVGTYVWATSAASNAQAPQFIFGNTFAGTGLFPAGLASLSVGIDTNSMKYSSGNAIGVMDTTVSALSGTWRCMAQTPPLVSNLDEQPMALFVRIS
tara:strand:+ start:245 stop:709 length:465 start_codon:yes stop_codon:yes gene_type:complete